MTMIDLGLARIGRLVQHTPRRWNAIHVAGTNGKGSICAYLSAMLHASGMSVARFTSPHIIDRWDCITVNEKPVAEPLFRASEDVVRRRNRDGQIRATQFELLTATAFEVFHRERVQYGVVEVGLGGRLDATNILDEKAVTVISKIGMDHQSFLGDTLEEIALHKAGIMRHGVPCVADSSNHPSVLEAIRQHANEIGADLVLPSTPGELKEELSQQGFEPHQIQNLACAHAAFQLACPSQAPSALIKLLPAVKQVQWPGRLQMVDISKICHRRQEALLDGAHNVQSAEALAAYVQKHLRRGSCSVTWVLAASAGKDITGMMSLLLLPQDRVAAVRFGPVDGMPWVAAEDPARILKLSAAAGVVEQYRHDGGQDLQAALQWAAVEADGGPIVIAGSLYLVSDTLRRLRG